jgi:hypothetical protein
VRGERVRFRFPLWKSIMTEVFRGFTYSVLEYADMSTISSLHDELSKVVLIKVISFVVIFTFCSPLPCISPVSCDPTDPIYLIYFRTFDIKATHSSCCGYNPSTASACFILEGPPTRQYMASLIPP